jgi:hypothetical protein
VCHQIHVQTVPELGWNQRREDLLESLVADFAEIEAQVSEGRDPRQAPPDMGIDG